jgi:hypothetical protein
MNFWGIFGLTYAMNTPKFCPVSALAGVLDLRTSCAKVSTWVHVETGLGLNFMRFSSTLWSEMKLTEVEEPALFLLGIELLDNCGQTLFETLERQLKPHFGEDWFSLSLVRTPEDRELAPRDLSVLLVQIEIRNNQKFRLALQSEYNSGRPLTKDFLENLKDLRIMRNEWFHRTISPITTDELCDLCLSIQQIFPKGLSISMKAKSLLEVLDSDSYSGADLMRTSKYVGSYISKLEAIEEIRRQEQEIEEILLESHIEEQTAILDEIMRAELEQENTHHSYVPSIGDPYTGSLLPQKYTLKLDGTIIDRREGIELREKLGERAISIGQLLLENHPTGGRLRLSSDGTVVGYEDEEWIVIGSIDLSNWFDV